MNEIHEGFESVETSDLWIDSLFYDFLRCVSVVPELLEGLKNFQRQEISLLNKKIKRGFGAALVLLFVFCVVPYLVWVWYRCIFYPGSGDSDFIQGLQIVGIGTLMCLVLSGISTLWLNYKLVKTRQSWQSEKQKILQTAGLRAWCVWDRYDSEDLVINQLSTDTRLRCYIGLYRAIKRWDNAAKRYNTLINLRNTSLLDNNKLTFRFNTLCQTKDIIKQIMIMVSDLRFDQSDQQGIEDYSKRAEKQLFQLNDVLNTLEYDLDYGANIRTISPPMIK